MLFKKKNYKVIIKGRVGIIYQEGNKLIKIDSEMLVGSQYDMVIYNDSIISWEPPYDNELLTDSEKERIKNNIIKEMIKSKIDWQ